MSLWILRKYRTSGYLSTQTEFFFLFSLPLFHFFLFLRFLFFSPPFFLSSFLSSILPFIRSSCVLCALFREFARTINQREKRRVKSLFRFSLWNRQKNWVINNFYIFVVNYAIIYPISFFSSVKASVRISQIEKSNRRVMQKGKFASYPLTSLQHLSTFLTVLSHGI